MANPSQDNTIHYNENVRKFSKSGKVDESAKKAEKAFENEDQAREMREAETEGKKPKRN